MSVITAIFSTSCSCETSTLQDHTDFLDHLQLWDLNGPLHDLHLWNLRDTQQDIDHLISVLQLVKSMDS